MAARIRLLACLVGLSLFVGAPPAAAGDTAALLKQLETAREAGDQDKLVELLPSVPKAFNGSEDDEERQSLVSELGYILFEEELTRARIGAATALGALEDREAAWYELEAFLPTADVAQVTGFERAVLIAAGRVGPKEVVDHLIELATDAAQDRLAGAAIEALANFTKPHHQHKRVLETLLRLAARLRAESEKGTRWGVVQNALRRTLRVLTGRKKASADDFATQGEQLGDWEKPKEGAEATKPAAKGPTRRATKLSSWDELFANLGHDDCETRLVAVDEIYDRQLVGEDIRDALLATAEKEEDWRVLSMCLRALQVQDTEREPAFRLLRQKKHKHWQVRLALAEGLIAFRHLKAVETLIDLLGDKRLRVRDGAAETLYRLTGKGHGAQQKRWAKWLRDQRGIIKFIPPKNRPKEFDSADRDSEYAGSYNRFFGSRIRSDRIVLVLDKSESMYYGLFDQVIEEVGVFLSASLPTTFFGVIEFDEHPRAWREQLAPANDKNADAVLTFLKRAKPYGPTNVMDSLRVAMGMRDVDTIMLLSDGLPNRGTPSAPKEILEAIQGVNRYARVAIHTLQMMEGRMFPHDGPRGDDKPPLDEKEKARRGMLREAASSTELGLFMKQIADQNDGTFAVVFADWYKPPPDAQFRDGTDK